MWSVTHNDNHIVIVQLRLPSTEFFSVFLFVVLALKPANSALFDLVSDSSRQIFSEKKTDKPTARHMPSTKPEADKVSNQLMNTDSI